MSIADRPVFKGLPVPYVAMWSGELWAAKRGDVLVEQMVGVLEGNPLVKPGERLRVPAPIWPKVSLRGHPRVEDELGVFWQPDGRGMTGEPLFGDVNCHRQVECMKKGLCQVCGGPADDETGWYWLMPEIEYAVLTARSNGVWTTPTPPVCADCVPHAQSLCPMLKKAHVLVRVKSYEPVTVWGNLIEVDPSNPDMAKQHRTDVPLGHPALRSTIGKQLVVRLELM